MTIFKRIDINLNKERKRINTVDYNKKQKLALLTLVDLFESGDWQACLDFVNNEENFPYNKLGEYPEQEHINVEISRVLHEVAFDNYYTKEQLIREIKEKI